MSLLSVTIARPMLLTPGDNNLVIPDHPGDDGLGFWLPEGITWPSFTMRRTYPTASEDIGGNVLRKAVRDVGQITIPIKAKAASTTLLIAMIDELEAATSQFTYDLTITLDSVARTWPADSELPQWGTLDSGEARFKMISASIVIPLNPRTS